MEKRRRAATRARMRVTTIALDAAQHRRLQRIALDEHTVLTELVREAVREWLRRRTRKRSARDATKRKKAGA
jgi:hypothetical protein